MTMTVGQHTSRFWLQKLQGQIAIINKQRESESLERLLALDIALAYLFLYLFLEATIDEIIWNILIHRGGLLKARQRYRERGRYLRNKLEFIFAEFCSRLPFDEFATLKQRIRRLINIRNNIVHLEELSWTVFWQENQKLKELPTKTTEYLTVRSLKQHYDDVGELLASLAVILNRGLDNATVDIAYEEGNHREVKTRNLVEVVYEMTVPHLKDFEEIG